jgi:hypothetical protein
VVDARSVSKLGLAESPVPPLATASVPLVTSDAAWVWDAGAAPMFRLHSSNGTLTHDVYKCTIAAFSKV